MIIKLGKVISEYSVRNKADEDIPVYSVTNDKGFCTNYFSKDVSSKDRTTYKIVPYGYFAYNPSRINVGSVDWQHYEKKVIVSPLYVVFYVDEVIDQRYLLHYLKSDITLKFIKSNSAGSVRDNLKLSVLQEFSINLRTKEEQYKIVNILDKVDLLISLYTEKLEKFDEFTKSLFIEMFGDISDQDKVEVSRICKLITDGTHQPPKFEERGIPFLFVSNIVTNNITYDTEKFISEETYKELIKRTPIEIGDLLLSTVGSYGHAAIVKFTKRFCFQRHIAYLKPKSKIVDSEYFRSAILSDNVQRQIHLGVKGIAQKTLNLSEIRKLRIPLPPMVQQQQFAKVVIEIDKSKLAVKKSLEELEVLKKSLMQKYFA